MSLYAANMTCYCVNLSYDEFIERIELDLDKYKPKLRDYAGNYLYFENDSDTTDYPGKIHHDLAIVNDRGEVTRIGANLYIDKDNNNESGFFEYDSRTHEVKIDRTKIREINGNLTIGKYKSIEVTDNNVTIKGKNVNVKYSSGNTEYNIISNNSATVKVGISPDKIYLGDVRVQDMLNLEDTLDKRTQSLITELNSWPQAVMNLYPIKSSLVSTVTAYASNNIDGKFVFTGVQSSDNKSVTGEIELLNIASVYHLWTDVLKSTNIFYIYADCGVDEKSQKVVNFYISSQYYNFIYVDNKYSLDRQFMNDATSVNSEFSDASNIYYKYMVTLPGLDENSVKAKILYTIWDECNKDTVDKDKVRMVQDILLDYNNNAVREDYTNLNITFKFRHVGFINVNSEITTTVIPATNVLTTSTKVPGVSSLNVGVSFYTQTNNSANPRVSSTSLMAGSKNSVTFNKYFAGVDKYNRSYNDYWTETADVDFNKCDNTKDILGRINRVFGTYSQEDWNKYYYTSQKSKYQATTDTEHHYYYATENFYKQNTEIAVDGTGSYTVAIYKGETFELPEYPLFIKQDNKYVPIDKSKYIFVPAHVLTNPAVTTWNYKEDSSSELVFNDLKTQTTISSWYKNIISKPVSGILKKYNEESQNRDFSKYEFSNDVLASVETLPIDYAKIFRYRLDNDTEWSNWMSLNNASIRINEDNVKLTIQVPSVGWAGNLGASGVFILSDLYRGMNSNNSILPSTYGTSTLSIDTGTNASNQKIFNWIAQSFTDACSAFKCPLDKSSEVKSHSMVSALTVNNVAYPGLLFSNALFMNMRNQLRKASDWDELKWSDENIDNTLTDFFSFKNVTGEETKSTNATTNYYLAEYTIKLSDYPITDKATNLTFKYVGISLHNDRYVYDVSEIEGAATANDSGNIGLEDIYSGNKDINSEESSKTTV